ncbi:MAG TPA: TetR/AcrR family transcriptional regulator, partial [Dehalococcoidia bacterium]|nr:TetR/AcrR family transcriptional regulator [Dehalococcoidia bacterium]
FHQTNIQDICKEAELSPGAVYRYFPSKDHIIAATCTDCQQGILDLIDSLDGPDHGRRVPALFIWPRRGASGPQAIQYPLIWPTTWLRK